MNPLLLTDFYKVHHTRMYPEGMTLLYSNLTPRKSRLNGVDAIIFFGLQHFVKTYLIDLFNKDFFAQPWAALEEEYTRHVPVDTAHIKALHQLGYLPIKIKALPEGTRCPIGVPCLTIRNTHPNFAWLTNYLETLLSASLWQAITSATLADQFHQLLSKWAIKTTGDTEGVQWQAHDFSMRGMSSIESAILSGMGHLTSFTGTDSIPAIYQLEKSYGATGLIGASVPATEHSVMCMGEKQSEVKTFSRLLDLYPSGILSVVSDTWDLWKVLTEYLPELKEQIMGRDGKLVIRPDSGDPVDIICGNIVEIKQFVDADQAEAYYREHFRASKQNLYRIGEGNVWRVKVHGGKDFLSEPYNLSAADKGVVELLWDVFGGTTNEQGYKVLDSHIGAIYGDSINLERAEQICQRLADKGFASTNMVFGVGSFTYQYNTRDTFGFAVKATYGELTHPAESEGGTGYIEPREIFKDPITDDGTKKSRKGLLMVIKDEKGVFHCNDQVNWELEENGELETVFEDSQLVKEVTLDEVRGIINPS
jgi:nicotinamide phosphoribosyltransferase